MAPVRGKTGATITELAPGGGASHPRLNPEGERHLWLFFQRLNASPAAPARL